MAATLFGVWAGGVHLAEQCQSSEESQCDSWQLELGSGRKVALARGPPGLQAKSSHCLFLHNS